MSAFYVNYTSIKLTVKSTNMNFEGAKKIGKAIL